MSTFLQDVEKIIKAQGEAGLLYLENYYGLEFELHREDSLGDKLANAYGSSAGVTASKIGEFKGVLQGNDFIQRSDHFTGNFEEGFLFVRGVDVRATDIIEVINGDGLVRKFKVESKESIGLTKTIFTMWNLTNLGE